MRVTHRVVNQIVILSLHGQLVFKERKVLQEAFKEALEKAPRKIGLNLEGLTYLDSAGLGLIALGQEQAKLQNIAFCLVNPIGPVKQILEMTHLPDLIPIYETEDQALRQNSQVFART